MRVFVDTNVLISAFIASGVSSKLFDLLNEEHEIIVSPQVLSEFRRVTTDKFRADPSMIQDFLAEVLEHCEVVLPPYLTTVVVRDPDDIEILAAALKSKADYLVSGDKDLLDVINSPIHILSPRALYDLLFSV